MVAPLFNTPSFSLRIAWDLISKRSIMNSLVNFWALSLLQRLTRPGVTVGRPFNNHHNHRNGLRHHIHACRCFEILSKITSLNFWSCLTYYLLIWHDMACLIPWCHLIRVFPTHHPHWRREWDCEPLFSFCAILHWAWFLWDVAPRPSSVVC